MKYFTVRVVEQTVHEFIVKAEDEEAVAEMDVGDECMLCGSDDLGD